MVCPETKERMENGGHGDYLYTTEDPAPRNDEERRDIFNLNPKPGRTKFREAVLVMQTIPAVVDGDYPETKKILLLAEKDQAFMRRLEEDKSFRDMFWFYTMVKWEPKTPEEELARNDMNEAITDRFELVITQKVLLGKVFHLLRDEEKSTLHQQVIDEMIFTNLWLTGRLPNYDNINRKFQIVYSLDFNKEDHDPADPIGRFDLKV